MHLRNQINCKPLILVNTFCAPNITSVLVARFIALLDSRTESVAPSHESGSFKHFSGTCEKVHWQVSPRTGGDTPDTKRSSSIRIIIHQMTDPHLSEKRDHYSNEFHIKPIVSNYCMHLLMLKTNAIYMTRIYTNKETHYENNITHVSSFWHVLRVMLLSVFHKTLLNSFHHTVATVCGTNNIRAHFEIF